MPDGQGVSVSRWEWDRSAEQVRRVMATAKRVTWASAAVFSLVFVATGYALATGVLRESAVIYGVAAGIACGYAVRGAYVAVSVRRAVDPVKTAIVPALVTEASEAQLAALVVNGGSMFRPYVVLRAVPDDARVTFAVSDLADRPVSRPGFLQLLLTGPDGIYYDDGHGTVGDEGGEGGAEVADGVGGELD